MICFMNTATQIAPFSKKGPRLEPNLAGAMLVTTVMLEDAGRHIETKEF